MTTKQIIEQLRALRLNGMADSLERQMKTKNHDARFQRL
jgi:hypothetical protein